MNWALQIKFILQQANMESLWEETDTLVIEPQLEKIITQLALQKWEEDWNYARTSPSSYYTLYTRLLLLKPSSHTTKITSK